MIYQAIILATLQPHSRHPWLAYINLFEINFSSRIMHDDRVTVFRMVMEHIIG